MKKLTDKEIQELVEKGIKDPENMDMEAYRQLFGLLAQEPACKLPANFSARVAGQIAAAQNIRLAFKFYVLAALLMVLIFALICLPLALSDTYADSIQSALRYKWALLFGLVIFIGVTYFDPKRPDTAEMA